jgi:hypothetical protein
MVEQLKTGLKMVDRILISSIVIIGISLSIFICDLTFVFCK